MPLRSNELVMSGIWSGELVISGLQWTEPILMGSLSQFSWISKKQNKYSSMSNVKEVCVGESEWESVFKWLGSFTQSVDKGIIILGFIHILEKLIQLWKCTIYRQCSKHVYYIQKLTSKSNVHRSEIWLEECIYVWETVGMVRFVHTSGRGKGATRNRGWHPYSDMEDSLIRYTC